MNKSRFFQSTDCEGKLSDLQTQWDATIKEADPNYRTIYDYLSVGVFLTSTIWGGLRTKIGRKLTSSLGSLSKAGIKRTLEAIGKAAPSLNKITGLTGAVSAEAAATGTKLTKSLLPQEKNLGKLMSGSKSNASKTVAKSMTKLENSGSKFARLRTMSKFSSYLKKASVVLLVSDIGLMVYDYFYPEAETQDGLSDAIITSSLDEVSNEEAKASIIAASYAAQYATNSQCTAAVDTMFSNLKNSITRPEEEINAKRGFIEGYAFMTHIADQFVDDPQTRRAMAFQMMTAGAAMFNDLPYALLGPNDSLIPENDLLRLVTGLMMNMSECAQVLTVSDLEEINAAAFDDGVTILSDKLSAQAISHYFDL